MTARILNAVIGYPLEHSLSPLLHNTVYKHYGLPATMLPFPIQDCESYLQAARILGVQLTAVTLPHKHTIMPFLDEVDPLAQKIGAVNTVIQDEGRFKAYNTDIVGIEATLKGLDLAGKRVLVLGAGGVAHPLLYHLNRVGAHIVMTARHPERITAFAHYAIEFLTWEERGSFEGYLIVNTTPVGMAPIEEKSPLPDYAFQKNQVVFDIIYNPVQTQLLKDAARAEAKTLNGMTMFITQAYEQIRLWSHISPHLPQIETLLTQSL